MPSVFVTGIVFGIAMTLAAVYMADKGIYLLERWIDGKEDNNSKQRENSYYERPTGRLSKNTH